MTTGKLEKGILVVEPNESAAFAIQAVLEKNGYFAILATDAQSALFLVSTRRPSAVLLDFHVPGTDGLQLIKMIKDTGVPAPILVLSEDSPPGMAERAINVGAVDFLHRDNDLVKLAYRLGIHLFQPSIDQIMELLKRAAPPPIDSTGEIMSETSVRPKGFEKHVTFSSNVGGMRFTLFLSPQYSAKTLAGKGEAEVRKHVTVFAELDARWKKIWPL